MCLPRGGLPTGSFVYIVSDLSHSPTRGRLVQLRGVMMLKLPGGCLPSRVSARGMSAHGGVHHHHPPVGRQALVDIDLDTLI